MRAEYKENRFQALGAEIIAIAPDPLEDSKEFWKKNGLSFPCLIDPSLETFRKYEVHSSIWSLGQRPGLYVVDPQGIIRFAHVGFQQWEIPKSQVVLEALSSL